MSPPLIAGIDDMMLSQRMKGPPLLLLACLVVREASCQLIIICFIMHGVRAAHQVGAAEAPGRVRHQANCAAAHL